MDIVTKVGSTSNRSREQQIEAKSAIDNFHKDNIEEAVLVYTDGSVKNRHESCLSKSLGYGACSSIMFLLEETETMITSTKEVGMITNNVECEVEGIALALRELSKLMLNSRCKKKEAFILSDCQAAIDIVCLQNNKSYRTNTLRGIWRSIKELEDAGVSTKVAWCPGHCGIEGNEIADKKAKEAAELMSFAQEHHSQMKMINNDTAKKIIGEQQMRD